MAPKKAIILLSGGIDSATAAAIAQRDEFELCALTFRYGQRHEREIEAAKKVAAWLGIQEHLTIDCDLRGIGGSALTDRIQVPKGRSAGDIAHGIPMTYVPARNTIFLAFGLALAEKIGAPNIFFGANQLDYSGYPDCRDEYVRAFEKMANLATKAAVEGRIQFQIHTPLMQMTKAEIIRQGAKMGLDYSLTWSCYDPTGDGKACGLCDSCQLRLKGFKDAGLSDTIPYATV
jgi:7-cyano-7-deazaguanine synthase